MSTGSARFESWIRLLSTVATDFLQSSDWNTAFAKTGLIGNMEHLSPRLLAHLAGINVQVQAAPSQPTLEQVTACLPRNAKVHYPIWMHQPQGRKRWIFLIATKAKHHKSHKTLTAASSA